MSAPIILRPPRLQHSPSLPNIPFTRNTPADSENMQQTQRPSPPSSPKPAISTPAVETRTRYPSIGQQGRTPKTHARRRTERDQPHSLLLTPPLTPSSSIRTTASQGSSNADAQSVPSTADGEEIEDPDPKSTRILLLGNLNHQASGEKIRSAIVDILFASTTSKENITRLFIHSPSNDTIVKGSNELHLQTKGHMYIVFWDVRVAKKAQDILLGNDVQGMQPFLGPDVDENGKPLGFSVRLVTLNDLPSAISRSRILDGVEDHFKLQLQKVDEESTAPQACSDLEGDGKSFFRQGINISILQSMLKSFGRLRFFKFDEQSAEMNKNILTYVFEFFNMKDGLNIVKDIDDKVVFGVKIKVFRIKSVAENEPRVGPRFPGEGVGDLEIVPAGSRSQMRIRFNPVQPSATSPTVFYTSPPFDSINGQYATGHSPSGPPSAQVVGIPPRQISFPEKQWDNEVTYPAGTNATSLTCYAPGDEGSCIYCPSKDPPSAHPAHTNINFGTHYAILPPPPPQGTVYYAPPISPGVGIHHAYEYYPMDPQQLQVPAPNVSSVGPWPRINYNFDPAIAAVSAGPPSAPYLIREDMISPGPQYYYPSPYMPTPDQQPPHFFLPQHQQQVIVPANVPSPQAFAHISPPSSGDSPSSVDSTSNLVVYEPKNANANANASLSTSGQGERNQLNISRIESGVDTRTTVMIKNIPNKMSDTDLENYIAQVCPRRIDFMYLRIDFKNGCNVGYAFVNFITVEDLLRFSKERLGTKWNMFSSEKILQMSYGNYQGKEALVEKFKNSAIMDECEAWRPRIFYSSGPEQGLPEPFPTPTHIRRKERSSYNRGTLFPPGTNTHSSSSSSSYGGQGLLHNAPSRRFVDDRVRQMHNKNQNQNHLSIDAISNRFRRAKITPLNNTSAEERADAGGENNTTSDNNTTSNNNNIHMNKANYYRNK